VLPTALRVGLDDAAPQHPRDVRRSRDAPHRAPRTAHRAPRQRNPNVSIHRSTETDSIEQDTETSDGTDSTLITNTVRTTLMCYINSTLAL
jgi:hypothetical protein